MDQTYLDEQKAKTRSLIETMSLEEVSYLLGRYCGPSNAILCEKKYGFSIHKETVERYLFEKDFVDNLEKHLITES